MTKDHWKALGGFGIITLLLLLCGLAAAAPAKATEPNCQTFDRTPFYSGAMTQTKGDVTITLGTQYQAGRDWRVSTPAGFVVGEITIRSNGGEQSLTGQTTLNGDYGSDVEWATICVYPEDTGETVTRDWWLPNGGTPENVTWPQPVYTDQTCGWVQRDTYKYGTAQQRAIVDALDDDGLLSKGEDSSVYIDHDWVRIHGCVPTKPVDPEPRTKVTDRCQDAARITDYYVQTYALVDNVWVLGPEKWDHKTVEPLSADQCGYTPQTWDKVTVRCEPNKNYVFTDHYVKNWSYDKVRKSWVLDTKWTWLSKDRTDATEAQCPVVTDPEEEPSPTPTEPEPTPTTPVEQPTTSPSPTTPSPSETSTSVSLPSSVSPQPTSNVTSENSPKPSVTSTKAELAWTGTSTLPWALGALALIGVGVWMKWRARNA